MLYTTYISNLKNIPQEVEIWLITRFIPKSFNPLKHPEVQIKRELSPSEPLLLRYKRDGNWERFAEGFRGEFKNRPDLRKGFQTLIRKLQTGKDICLVCYEKEFEICHRSLLGKEVEKEGIDWQEILQANPLKNEVIYLSLFDEETIY